MLCVQDLVPDSDLNSVGSNMHSNKDSRAHNASGEGVPLFSTSNGSNDNNAILQGEEGTTKMNYLVNTPNAGNR